MSTKKNICILSVILSISLVGNVLFIIDAVHDYFSPSKEVMDKSMVINCYDDNLSFCHLMNNYGPDTALPYAMFLADVAGSDAACYYVWTLTEDFYEKDLKMDIPEHAFEVAMSYLEKGASNMDLGCLSALKNIYEEGKYVPKDLAKAQEYKKLYVTALKGN